MLLFMLHTILYVRLSFTCIAINHSGAPRLVLCYLCYFKVCWILSVEWRRRRARVAFPCCFSRCGDRWQTSKFPKLLKSKWLDALLLNTLRSDGSEKVNRKTACSVTGGKTWHPNLDTSLLTLCVEYFDCKTAILLWNIYIWATWSCWSLSVRQKTT